LRINLDHVLAVGAVLPVRVVGRTAIIIIAVVYVLRPALAIAFAYFATLDFITVHIWNCGWAIIFMQRHGLGPTTQAPPRRDGVARVEVPGRVVLFAAL
jgi:hypothetical protein